MIVRELLTALGWEVDEKGANQYDKRNAKLRTDTEKTIAGLARTWESLGTKIDRALSKADQGLARIENTASGVANSLGGLATMLGGGLGIAWFAEVTSTFTDLESRLKVALGGSEQAAADMMTRLGDVANMTYQDIEGTIDAYLQLRPNLDALGTSAADQVTVLTSINDAMTIGGIKGDNAARAIMWLNRSFGAGKVTAEAFNNLMESADDVMNQLQASLGVTREQFLEMGKSGKISAKMLEEHFLKTAAESREAAESMPVTIADAMSRMRGKLRQFVYEADRARGASQRIVDVLLWFADRPAIAATAAFSAMGLAVFALAAQMVAWAAGGVRAILSVVAALRKLRMAQLAAAATNPFVWAAGAVIALQDFITWAEGGDSALGRLIGRFEELQAAGAADRSLGTDFLVRMAESTNATTESVRGLITAWQQFMATPTDSVASWSDAMSTLVADGGASLWGGGFEFNWEGSPLDKGLKALGVDASALWAQLSAEGSAAWTTIATKLDAELSGAWVNVKASWSGMVEGFKSTWASAVEAMIGTWERFKTAISNTAFGRAVGGAVSYVKGKLGLDAPEVPGSGGTPIPQRRGGGPVNRGLYLVGEEGPEIVEMGGSGFVTPARQTRTYFDSLIDRGAAFGDRAAAGVAAVGMALSPVAAAASVPSPAQQAAYMRPASAGGGGVNIGNISLSAPVTIERGAIPAGVSEERVAEIVAARSGAEAERVLRRAVAGAARHFTEQEE